MSWLIWFVTAAWSMPAQEAVDAALGRSPTLDVSEARIDEAEARRREVRGYMLPTVTVTGTARVQTYFEVDMLDQIALPIPAGTDTSLLIQPWVQAGAGLQVVQPLIAPQAWSGTKAADDRIDLAQEQREADKSMVARHVVQAWHDNAEAQALLADARSAEELAARLVEKGEKLVELGAIAPDQVLPFQRAHASARAQVRVAEEGVAATAGVLQYLTGLSGEADAPDVPAEVPDLQAVLSAIDRPDLRAADKRSEVATRAVKVEKGGLYPTVALVGGANVLGPPADIAKTFMWRVGLEAQIPLFQGGRVGSRVETAGAQAAQAEAGERALREQAEVEVRAAHGALSRAMASLGESEEAMRLADLAVEAAERRFDSGGGSLLQLQQAQMDRSVAQLQRTRARAGAARAADMLRLAVAGAL